MSIVVVTDRGVVIRPQQVTVATRPESREIVVASQGLQGQKGDTGPGGSPLGSTSTGAPGVLELNKINNLTSDSLQIMTIPSAMPGDQITVFGSGSGLFRLEQSAGQQIKFNSSKTTEGITGRVDSLNQGASITLFFDGVLWVVTNSSGNFDII